MVRGARPLGRWVDDDDLAALVATYSLSAGDSAFLRYFDFDARDRVDDGDWPEFSACYGTRLHPP